MKAFKEFVKNKMDSSDHQHHQQHQQQQQPPPQHHSDPQQQAPSSGAGEDRDALLRNQSDVFARQSQSQRFLSAKGEGESGGGGDGRSRSTSLGASSAAAAATSTGSATATAFVSPSSPGSPASPSALASAVWIDTESKRSITTLCDDFTILTAKSFNNPSLGLYHVQQHGASRIPRIIDCGRSLGTLCHANEGVLKDSTLVVQHVSDLAECRAFSRIADSLQSNITRIRGQLPRPPPPPAGPSPGR